MINARQFAALLGFAFVAAWISLNFGYALLCLAGAGAFYLAANLLEGGLDVAELQARFSPEGGTSQRTRSGSRARVQ